MAKALSDGTSKSSEKYVVVGAVGEAVDKFGVEYAARVMKLVTTRWEEPMALIHYEVTDISFPIGDNHHSTAVGDARPALTMPHMRDGDVL